MAPDIIWWCWQSMAFSMFPAFLFLASRRHSGSPPMKSTTGVMLLFDILAAYASITHRSHYLPPLMIGCTKIKATHLFTSYIYRRRVFFSRSLNIVTYIYFCALHGLAFSSVRLQALSPHHASAYRGRARKMPFVGHRPRRRYFHLAGASDDAFAALGGALVWGLCVYMLSARSSAYSRCKRSLASYFLFIRGRLLPVILRTSGRLQLLTKAFGFIFLSLIRWYAFDI